MEMLPPAASKSAALKLAMPLVIPSAAALGKSAAGIGPAETTPLVTFTYPVKEFDRRIALPVPPLNSTISPSVDADGPVTSPLPPPPPPDTRFQVPLVVGTPATFLQVYH